MPLAPHLDVRRFISRAGLAALLLGTAMGLTQCVQVTQVTDPIAGSSVATFSHQKTGDCYTDCTKAFARALVAETELYLSHLKACKKDKVCIALERARHDSVVDKLKDEFRACRDNCHHQGCGGGHDGHH